MKFIQGSYEHTIIINKSRFIAQAFRVNNLEEIKDILAKTKKKYYDATHNCFAYRLAGDIQKMSDDGEPAKTAGAPILDVLIKKDITNILVIVTRYFGGILLGAGGLVRAYSTACSSVFENASFYEYQIQTKLKITISYSSYQTLIKMMPYIKIQKTSFMDEVIIEGYCENDLFDKIEKDSYLYKIADLKVTNLGTMAIEIPSCTLT